MRVEELGRSGREEEERGREKESAGEEWKKRVGGERKEGVGAGVGMMK